MKLTVVTTLYQSSLYIASFYKRASLAAREIAGDDFQIVFVCDGSKDESLNLAIELADLDSHVVLIELSRNFGHHHAMMAGLSYSKGDLVFLIDSDLEERPEWLLEFNRQLKQESCDVVFGLQERRKGGWFERCSGWVFYKIFNVLTGLELPENIVTARLMTRRYVDALLMHQERSIFIAGLWSIAGFYQSPCIIEKSATSNTTYSLQKKVSLLINAISAFSDKPLVVIFYIGMSILFLSIGYIFFILLYWLILERPISGWTSVIASIWLLGGLIISFIGVIGIYLSRVFAETKQRPNFIVRQIYVKKSN